MTRLATGHESADPVPISISQQYPIVNSRRDAPDHVMNVAAVHRNIVEGSNIVVNCDRNAADNYNRDKEAHRREEQTFAPGFPEALFVDGVKAAAGEDQR